MNINRLEGQFFSEQTRIGTSNGGRDFITQENTSKENGMTISSAHLTKEVTYGKPGKENGAGLDEIMAEAGTLDAVQMKNEMVVGADTTTEKDAAGIEDDGFSLRDTEIKEVITETDKMQAMLIKAGADVSSFASRLSEDKLRELGVSASEIAAATSSLKENVGAVKYLVENGLEPTVKNITAALGAGSGFVVAPNEDFNEKGIENQFANVLAASGNEVNPENLYTAKLLAANGVAITSENLSYAFDLMNAKLPPSENFMEKSVAEAALEGKAVTEVIIVEGYTNLEKAGDVAYLLEEIGDDELSYVIDNGENLTISNLREAHNLIKSGTVSVADREEGLSNKGLSLLTARRTLEETRLLMTKEASYSLIKKGIDIDTKPLEKLVEDLKADENAYYKNLLGEASSDENVELFKNVLDTAKTVEDAPLYAIGRAVNFSVEERMSFNYTLAELRDESLSLKAKMDAAGEVYDTMRTQVRSDMGDSIQKAFQNVDEILKDLGFEENESNRRAVRILGYNDIKIDADNITKMKQADMVVQKAFDSLKPATVRTMIKEGINPLNMNLTELNAKADEISRRLGVMEDMEKYSKYLWKLDHNGSITPEERESYIGIYRLINQVNSGDMAAVGAVVESGKELTMGNLLSAIRSEKKSGMDVKVDEDFGGVSGSFVGESISSQINAAFELECFKSVGRIDPSPEQFSDLLNSGKDFMEMTPEEFLNSLGEASEDDKLNEAYYKDALFDFENAKNASESVYRMLDGSSISMTVNNILAMQQMIYSPNKALNKLLNQRPENFENDDAFADFEKIKNKIFEDFAEAVKNPEELCEATETLYEVAEHCGQTMIRNDMTTMDLRELKLSVSQLFIGTKMARNEHYNIPVKTAEGYASLSLKVVRDSDEKGKVAISMETSFYGKLAAEIKAEKNGITGYIACDSRFGVEEITRRKDDLNSLFMSSEISVEFSVDIKIVYSSNLNTADFMSKMPSSVPSTNEEAFKVQTSKLYGIAENLYKFFTEGLG